MHQTIGVCMVTTSRVHTVCAAQAKDSDWNEDSVERLVNIEVPSALQDAASGRHVPVDVEYEESDLESVESNPFTTHPEFSVYPIEVQDGKREESDGESTTFSCDRSPAYYLARRPDYIPTQTDFHNSVGSDEEFLDEPIRWEPLTAGGRAKMWQTLGRTWGSSSEVELADKDFLDQETINPEWGDLEGAGTGEKVDVVRGAGCSRYGAL